MPALHEVFPPFGLKLRAGPLELLPITDDIIPGLIDLADAGVHSPDVMPFAVPWTDDPPHVRRVGSAQFYWQARASFKPAAWAQEFAVIHDGVLVGAQAFTTHDFLVTRSGETGSWIGQAHQGRGIGTLMRQAICAWCFDHLDAELLTSGAYLDNPSSLAVSRKVGYRENGLFRHTHRAGQWGTVQKLVLTPETFVRGPDRLEVVGNDAFRRFIGLDAPAP